jgi:hypothetical protein
MQEPTFSIRTRSTGMGAITYASIINPDGSERPADKHEHSKSGNHGEDSWFGDLSKCLILVVDFTNSQKDHSRIEQQPDTLTEQQKVYLDEFKAVHFL